MTPPDTVDARSICANVAARPVSPWCHADARSPRAVRHRVASLGGLTYHVAMTTRTPLTERETLERYEKRGALLRGHFRLTSGLHSDIYLQSALVLQHPEDAGVLGEGWPAAFRDERVAAVLAPAIGGILVAHEVARALGVRALFTERETGMMRLRRGFTLSPGERCLVVEDVITTGGSTREVMHASKNPGGVVIGVGSLIDRSGGTATFTMKHVTLATVTATTYQPEQSPAVQNGQPGHQARQPHLRRPKLGVPALAAAGRVCGEALWTTRRETACASAVAGLHLERGARPQVTGNEFQRA